MAEKGDSHNPGTSCDHGAAGIPSSHPQEACERQLPPKAPPFRETVLGRWDNQYQAFDQRALVGDLFVEVMSGYVEKSGELTQDGGERIQHEDTMGRGLEYCVLGIPKFGGSPQEDPIHRGFGEHNHVSNDALDECVVYRSESPPDTHDVLPWWRDCFEPKTGSRAVHPYLDEGDAGLSMMVPVYVWFSVLLGELLTMDGGSRLKGLNSLKSSEDLWGPIRWHSQLDPFPYSEPLTNLASYIGARGMSDKATRTQEAGGRVRSIQRFAGESVDSHCNRWADRAPG
ncbi:hypothetical protein CRG98_020418 [Punica granatum]|uniref:Uncharacterized protein n=1 Tax=Punica granatum TaxID=22663 RepID=A0A2I0JS98_PUNGR|nr:hypothetical protein CRG98_020418 [Punica granatum]